MVANIGGNVGINPLAGIPLPFLSYGGSALITQLAGLGLVAMLAGLYPALRASRLNIARALRAD